MASIDAPFLYKRYDGNRSYLAGEYVLYSTDIYICVQNAGKYQSPISFATLWKKTLFPPSSGGVTSVTATLPLTSSGGLTPDISSTLVQNRLLGRGSVSGTGVFEAITLGTGLSLAGTVLNGTGGTVTSVTATLPLTSSGGVTPDISSTLIQNRLLGRGAASGTGVFEAIVLGTNLSLAGTTLNAASTPLTLAATQIGYGSGANLLTGNANFYYDTAGQTFGLSFGGGVSIALNEGASSAIIGALNSSIGSVGSFSFQTTGTTSTIEGGGGIGLQVDSNRNLYTPLLHNNGAAFGDANNGEIRDGTYTPTILRIDNLNSDPIPNAEFQFCRIGNWVGVSGVFDNVDPTAANTDTYFDISVPINSNFVTIGNCGGNGSVYIASTINDEGLMSIVALSSNTVRLRWLPGNPTPNTSWSISFFYQVLN